MSWQCKPMESIAEIRVSNVDKKSYPGEFPVRLCNYMDVYSREYITEDIEFMEATASPAEIQRFGVERGDVMLTKDSETPDDIGIASVVTDDVSNLVCGYHLALIKPDKKQIDPIFLAKQLAHAESAKYFSRLANGSTRYGLAYQAIAKTPVRLAPLDQQRRIAEILSTVDEAIAQTEALIAKTQQIKAGLMHDLFTRGVTADGQLRPPREEAPHLYKESPLGWIPKAWDVAQTCGKISVIDPQPDHRTPPETPEGYPYVGLGDITIDGKIDFISARKVSSSAINKQLLSFEIFPGAFIFGKIGTLGQPTRIPYKRFFALSANIILFTSTNFDDSTFIYWFYNSKHIDKQIIDATNTTSQPALGIQKIRQFYLAWPASCKERKRISLKLELIETELQLLALSRDKLIKTKLGLMHDLLTGRVAVSGA